VDLFVTTKSGVGLVTTTRHHRIWDATSHRWIQAAEVQVGHRIRSQGGKTYPITAVRLYVDLRVTYDITVNRIHTYYVHAGTASVLVHNSDGCVSIDDSHIAHNHTPEGIFSGDTSKTEWAPGTTPASRAAAINEVLARGRVVTGTKNRDGIVKELTYDKPIGYTRGQNRRPLYTLRVYYGPASNHVRNAFPVR
jgi:hypothetical protein